MAFVALLLIVTALGLLVVGLAAASSPLIAASIGLSIIALISMMVVRVRLRLSAGGAPSLMSLRGSPSTSGSTSTSGSRSTAHRDPSASQNPTARQPPNGPNAQLTAGADGVWVIPGRALYHRQGCAFIAGRDAVPMTRSQAARQRYGPCALCDPDGG